MTFTLSAGVGNAMVDAMVDSLDGAGAGTFKIYDGTRPASPDTAASSTLLATFTLSNPAFGSAASKAAAVNAIASVSAVATGTAAWFRAANSAGTAKFDGTVTVTGGGGDLTINTTALTAGGTVTVTGGSVALP